jgi:hypothetical protein
VLLVQVSLCGADADAPGCGWVCVNLFVAIKRAIVQTVPTFVFLVKHGRLPQESLHALSECECVSGWPQK